MPQTPQSSQLCLLRAAACLQLPESVHFECDWVFFPVNFRTDQIFTDFQATVAFRDILVQV